MDKKFYELNPEEFAVWLGNFNTVASANAAVINFDAALLSSFKTLKNELDAQISAEQAAQQAAKAANIATHNKHQEALEKVSFYNTTIKADENIPDEVKIELGFQLDDKTPSTGEPQVPLNLFAKGFSNDVNSLAWKRNGNNERTQFIIEAQTGDATEFGMVGSTTRTKFDHEGQKPGVQVVYRVYAQRGKQRSQPSNEAIVYQQ